MAFLSELTFGVTAIVHDTFIHYFGDITNTVHPPPPANFGVVIYIQVINTLSHTATHLRFIEMSKLPCFTPFLEVCNN